MSSSALQVRIASRTVSGREVWEGTASVPGLKATKLVRKSDSSTYFATRSAVATVARNLARNLGFTGVDFGTAQVVRKAAARRRPTTPPTATSNS